MICTCESLYQSDSQLQSEDQKMANHFSFLESSPDDKYGKVAPVMVF